MLTNFLHGKPGRHICPRPYWELTYFLGRWDYLRNEKHRQRFQWIARTLSQRHVAPSVLDVGAGEGLLLPHLIGVSYYEGIDFCEVAIGKARKRFEPAHTFKRIKLEKYQAVQRFDCIVFNEVLYYLKYPVSVLINYLRFLKPGGSLLITMYRNPRTKRYWEEIEKENSFALQKLATPNLDFDSVFLSPSHQEIL